MSTLNVLVTAGSRRVPLVRMFQRALAELQVTGEVIVTDVNALSPAVHLADRAYRVPYATDDGYIESVLDVCQRAAVGLVVPTIDDELPVFGKARARFDAAGIVLAVSPWQTTETCNDKLATSEFLLGHGIEAARTFLPADVPASQPMPLFVKPRYGRGGVGAFAARTRKELAFFSSYVSDAVVQEFLDGPEFTLDMMCDFEGRVLAIVPRERVVIRAGVSDRGRTVHDPRLLALAMQTASAFRLVGAVNVQCRVVNGRPVIFEINPRFSGGIPLTVAAGADFPKMLVELALGRGVIPCVGRFIDNLWMTSFESSLFLDEADLASALEPGRARMREAS